MEITFWEALYVCMFVCVCVCVSYFEILLPMA